MPVPPGIEGDICALVKLLETHIARLEQVTKETGICPMDTSTSETVETNLLNAVAALRRTRNSIRPVNKLPVEILSSIFFLVPGPDHDYTTMGCPIRHFFEPRTVAPVADLLPLLTVCSLWRSVATSSSFLWSTIDNRNPRAFAVSTKYQPVYGLLDVHIKDTFDSPERSRFDGLRRVPKLHAIFMDLLRNEGHRIREFHADVIAFKLPELLEFPGESLQRCNLRLFEITRGQDDLGAIRPLFRGHTPKLESLLMENILFIPTNHFPSLTHLILGGHKYFRPTGPYTFHNFLIFLSRCPKLEVLHLFYLDMAKFDEIPGGRVFAPLKLPHLRKFSNEDVFLDLILKELPYRGPGFRHAILNHLEFSPDCVIRLSAILPDDLARTLASLPFYQPFTSMYLSAHNTSKPWHYRDRANGLRPECFSIMATDRNQPRGIRIDFQMPGERYYAQNVTPQSARASISAAIRESPLLSSVHELWVVPGANLLLGEPCSLLAGFRHLRTLVLGLHSVSLDTPWDVKCHWEPLRGLEVRDTDRVIPCPRLCTLCVYVTTEAHVVNLYALLLSRGEAGYPIRRLIVGFYHPPSQTVLDLVEGLWGLVKDFTLLKHGEWCPNEFLWMDRLPPVCRDDSEHNFHWPAWI